MSKSSWNDVRCPFPLATKDFRRSPYEYLSMMRRSSAAVVVAANGFRMWLVSRYDDARRVLKDQTLMKDVVEHRKALAIQCVISPERRARLPHASRRSLLDRDGLDHRRLRTLLRGEFSQSMVDALRPTTRALARKLIHELPRPSHVDLVADYSRPYCMQLAADIFGVPVSDALAFPDWENSMLTGTSLHDVEAGGQLCHDFGLRMIAYKSLHRGNDVFTRLLDAHSQGLLDTDELASTYIVLMVGASETSNAITNCLRILLGDPLRIALLRSHPENISEVINEGLRLESPFRLLPPRFSDRPVLLDGVTIPAGEMIAVSPAAANRDPNHFSDPDYFSPSSQSREHLSFGDGSHKCLGSLLARMQAEEAVLAIAEELPLTSVISTDDMLAWRPSDFMRRLQRLTVVLQ